MAGIVSYKWWMETNALLDGFRETVVIATNTMPLWVVGTVVVVLAYMAAH